MRLLSPLLRQIVYPALRNTGYFHAADSVLPAVLTYHGVLPDRYPINEGIPDGPLLTAENFRKQLRALKTYYRVISPEEFFRWLKYKEPLPARAVLLTCDDGLLNHRTEMLPILLEERVSCLFFVTGACAEASPGMLWYAELFLTLAASQKSRLRFSFKGSLWDEPLGAAGETRATWQKLLKCLSQFDADYRKQWLQQAEAELGISSVSQRCLNDSLFRRRFALMSKDDLKELVDSGMSLGAHTMSHPLLSQQGAGSGEYEICESRRVLTQAMGVPIWSMAYPFGHSESITQREPACAQSAGYDCAFLNCGGPLRVSSPLFALPRIHVTPEMRLSELEAHLSGFHWKLQQCLQPARNFIRGGDRSVAAMEGKGSTICAS
jgi:peptidoglycan/xylan/chitin deacetylase (PgdA/CDA1 family)